MCVAMCVYIYIYRNYASSTKSNEINGKFNAIEFKGEQA